MKENLYQNLPQIEQLLNNPRVSSYFSSLSRPLVADICSQVLEKERRLIKSGSPSLSGQSLESEVLKALGGMYQRKFRRIINATGVILHTNMGRSPLSDAVWESAREINTRYSNLEMDIKTGKRGRRGGITHRLLSLLTGAESALLLNNNAAALFLLLSAFAKGKEVIVSRGEQVQIGGGFRIPEILKASGALLVEVGTTNITTLSDYLDAVTGNTAMVLIVHPSNFAIHGFTEKPKIRELSSALPAEVILAVDQGSGTMDEIIEGDISVIHTLKRGADIVCFSTDKVLGGPQGGVIAGKSDLINILAKHPLMRILRPGKTVYSLLEAALTGRLNKNIQHHTRTILSLSGKELKKRAMKITSGFDKGFVKAVPSDYLAGGGTSPAKALPSWSVRITSGNQPEKVLEYLRSFDPPIIGTISEGGVLLNTATLFPEDIGSIRSALLNFIDMASIPK